MQVLRLQSGRTVEFDKGNPKHLALVSAGRVAPEWATVSRLRRAFWVGDVCLADGESPFPHRSFPYVRFLGFQEDLSGVPYGYVRGMKYAQDSLNSGNSKLRWGMSVVRVERTKGAVEMTDAQLRRQIARSDADIVLSREHMAQPGARFEVKRDFDLSQQHWQMLHDNRETIQRVSGITASFMGRQGSATSGVQEQTQVEQGNQALGRMMDNFRDARTRLGNLLLSLIIEDMGREEQSVVIAGDAMTANRTVFINRLEHDPVSGVAYLSNDLQNTRLKVALEDVPSTRSYRGQQLNAMSEAVKSLPSDYQAAMLPFMVALMDLPSKDKVIEAVKQLQQQPSQEQIQQQIEQAVQEALAKSSNELKRAELEIKRKVADSEVKANEARAVQIGVQAAFAAMQAGGQVAQMPQIAPIADVVMQGAGYVKPIRGDDPNFPQPVGVAQSQPQAVSDVSANDVLPVAKPVSAVSGAEQGVETVGLGDNLGGTQLGTQDGTQ
ncbi:portal protein [Kingella negevensis]|uniref:portal protein n=1 Tax=Kingella negevensis TaxID=1522312 RepID=UPI000A402D81|nr:hypothetical protein [Kingella negevensis]